MAFELLKHQDGIFREWNKNQLYFGTPPAPGVTLHVPNIDDAVTDWSVGKYRVSAVDPITNIPTLELKFLFTDQSVLDRESTSLVTALSIYQPTALTRAFYDDSVSPATITIDTMFRAYGSEPDKMIFFLGTDVSAATGVIISERYNTGGTLIGNDVPLEKLVPSIDTEKRPATFATTHPLANAEVITGVAYNATGGVVSKQVFLLTASATIRPPAASDVYLTDVTLRSSLLSATDTALLENHLGTPFTTALVKAVLHYSDGSETEINVDGTKCVLQGVEYFDTSLIGPPTNLVLTYYPSASEPFINGGGGGANHLSRHYRLANTAIDTSFSLKLYVVPTYIDVTTGYTYKWRITNLAGDLDVDVTSDVVARHSDGSAFSGTDYTTAQEITMSLDMDTVAPGTYPGHVHTQRLTATMNIPGSGGYNPWILDYIGDGSFAYGQNTNASASNLGAGAINIGMGTTSEDAFLLRLYSPIAPLFDITAQPEPTRPTHFKLEYGGVSSIHEISEYNSNITKVGVAPAFGENTTVNVVWIFRGATGDRILGHSPMIIRLDL